MWAALGNRGEISNRTWLGRGSHLLRPVGGGDGREKKGGAWRDHDQQTAENAVNADDLQEHHVKRSRAKRAERMKNLKSSQVAFIVISAICSGTGDNVPPRPWCYISHITDEHRTTWSAICKHFTKQDKTAQHWTEQDDTDSSLPAVWANSIIL